MTQTTDTTTLILNKLDGISSDIDVIKSDIDAIKSDVTEIKISQARTDERLNSLEDKFSEFKVETATRFSDLKGEVKDIRGEIKGQDARMWGFVIALFLSLAGVLAKVVFFPQL